MPLEDVFLSGEVTHLIDFTFGDDPAAGPDLSFFIQDLLSGPYMPAAFIIEHVPGGGLHFLLVKDLPLAENKMDVIIGHCLVVMQRRDALNAVGLPEFFREQPEQDLPVEGPERFRQGDDQFPRFNAASGAAAPPEVEPVLFGQVTPEVGLSCGIHRVEMLLAFRAADIIDAAVDVTEFCLLDK